LDGFLIRGDDARDGVANNLASDELLRGPFSARLLTTPPWNGGWAR